MSRATISVSAMPGQAPRPSFAEMAPSCMWPPLVRVGSSSCSAIGRFSGRAYCRARRISRALAIGEPSSVKPAAPRAARSRISVSDSPARSMLTAARKPVWMTAISRARSSAASSVVPVSIVGAVFGIDRIVV